MRINVLFNPKVLRGYRLLLYFLAQTVLHCRPLLISCGTYIILTSVGCELLCSVVGSISCENCENISIKSIDCHIYFFSCKTGVSVLNGKKFCSQIYFVCLYLYLSNFKITLFNQKYFFCFSKKFVINFLSCE